jgi:hypothetical protein
LNEVEGIWASCAPDHLRLHFADRLAGSERIPVSG